MGEAFRALFLTLFVALVACSSAAGSGKPCPPLDLRSCCMSPERPKVSGRCTDPCAHQSPMLAAQVNARKYDYLRIILGFVWSGGLGLCGRGASGLAVDRSCSRSWCSRGVLDRRSPSPTLRGWLELWVPLALRAECAETNSRGSRKLSRLALTTRPHSTPRPRVVRLLALARLLATPRPRATPRSPSPTLALVRLLALALTRLLARLPDRCRRARPRF